MSARFTSAPWVAKRAADGGGDIGIVADNGCVAECYHDIRFHDEKAHEECLANARLIVASPDMYEVLEAIEIALDKFHASPSDVLDEKAPIMNALREALKKARGAV